MTKEKFIRIPIRQVTDIPSLSGAVELIRKHWWIVTENDEILLYRGFSRQCNTDKAIAEKVMQCKGHPGVDVRFLDVVYLPHDCRDYL